MGQFDIVARLQLSADQFVSEGGRAAASVKGQMTKAAADIRQPFVGAFAEVQKLAGTALTMPRTKGGSLNLSAEIASLREAEAESNRYAQAMRELSIAQTAAASSGKVDAAALHLEADASAVAALAHEREATGIRERIEALRIVQAELNKTASETTATASATRAMTKESGAAKAGWQQVGFQVQDAAVQIQGGTSIMTVAVQQGGQLFGALGLIAQGGAQASKGVQTVGEASGEAGVDIEGMGEKVTDAAEKAEGMGGKFGKVAGVLAGPWGAAITVGLAVLSPLVSKIFESNDAVGDQVEKLEKDAKATAVARDAKERFARSEAGVAAAIRDGTQATKDAIDATKSSAEQDNIAAKQALQREVAIRRTTLALLDQAKAESRQANSTNFGAAGGAGAAAAQTIYRNRVADLEQQAKEQQGLIAEAEARVQATRGALAAEAAQRAVDPMARIKKLYDDQAAAATRKATAEGKVTTELTRQLAKIETNRQAAIKAEQDRQSAANRKPREVSLGQQVSNDQGARILSSAQSFNGLRERDASDNALLRDLFGSAGIRIDPEKTAWCAAFVSAVLSGQGIKGTGSLAAKSYLGFGTATSKPEKGDVVVLKVEGGNHVGFYAGQKNGRVLVTGGNQSDQVSTTSFAMSQVAGFRRAPTAAADYKAELKDAAEAAREAKREQEELERALDGILKALDPAAAAMGRYTDRVADLAKLRAGGKIDDFQQVGYIRDARAALVADQSKISNDQFRSVIGAGEVDAANAYLDGLVKGAWGDLGQQLTESAQDARDALQQGADQIAGILGPRVFGALGSLANVRSGRFSDEKASALSEQLARTGIKIDKKSIQDVSSVLGAASAGRAGGSAFAAITGGKDNALASSIGGVLGQEAGKMLSKPIGDAIGGTLGKTLGGAAGPLGAIAGGIVGNLVGGLFQKVQKGSSTLTFGADGLAAGAATGNNSAAKAAAAASANTVVGSLNRIAEALGGSVTGAGSVTIGKYGNSYKVNTTGASTLKKGKAGVVDFDEDQEAAIRFAISDALADGVISGISAASKKILAAGGDLEKSITKAALIEAVPKDLKAMLDPLGAAIDELNTKFQKTVDALKEGGATAEQMAQAQQLYDLQLAEVKNSTASASASLKDFLKSLKLGSDSPLSARDREAAALADLQPFLTKIAAGQAIDQGKYQDAAKTYLDVERELYGSTAKFFDAFNAVQASTAAAIATIDNAVPVAAGVESPFAKATAASSAQTATAAQASAEIAAQHTELLMRMTKAIETLAAGSGGGGRGGFIGNERAFAA